MMSVPKATLMSLATLAVAIGGCASGGSGGDEDQTRYVERGLDAAERSVDNPDALDRASRNADQRPPMVVGATPVPWSTLRPLLAEAGGGQVVDEVALTLLLENECRRRDITITPADIDAERTLLIDTLTDRGVSAATPDNVERLVARVRAQRGLGPQRWKGLLQRNAMLRALVRDSVVISEEAVARVHDRLYGPDYPARLIVTATARDAAEVIRRVKAGEPFGEVAARVSIDPSAARGGIIEPINAADPTWPEPVRRAVRSMQPGQVSEPILLDEGYAVLWLERAPDPKGVPTIEAVRPHLERLVRREQERLLMQREARRLLDEARVDVLDQSLEWSRTSTR